MHRRDLFGALATSYFLLYAASAVAEVCVYEDRNYEGGRRCFTHDVHDFARLGINDKVSSITVHGNYEVTLYTNENFTGQSDVFSHSTRYVGNKLNDRVSSMRIRKLDGDRSSDHRGRKGWDTGAGYSSSSSHRGRGRVCLYRDEYYRGEERCFTHDVSDLREYGFGDTADSLRVRGNVEVILYRDKNFRGRSRTFSWDVPKFSKSDHDSFSSLRIQSK